MKKKTLIIVTVLLMALSLCLCACVPSNVEKAEKKLQNKGYSVEILSTDDIVGMFGDIDIKAVSGITAFIEESDAGIFAIWFEDKDSAEDFEGIFNLTKSYLEQEFEMEFEFGVKGKVFYFGDSQGVKDFTK